MPVDTLSLVALGHDRSPAVRIGLRAVFAVGLLALGSGVSACTGNGPPDSTAGSAPASSVASAAAARSPHPVSKTACDVYYNGLAKAQSVPTRQALAEQVAAAVQGSPDADLVADVAGLWSAALDTTTWQNQARLVTLSCWATGWRSPG
ncbi:hypothetical protein Val02_75740 [Virgisporangium aliadipatigenens]|uniref:Uncharacterized protein n=1 Tax=Virgisporangium aliadipatigenens TaxID=741659 RepID=A0A8J3YUE8_9ACTN|nr:hypothetical protein [Virgisporangium aliadipatigenens]GIJ50688.1 hypothetical protein Val02_75740 [Virgisporangium aliadipatigenens]